MNNNMLRFLLLLIAVFCSVAVSDRGITLEEKVRNLQDSIMKRPVMSLNLEMWKTYIQSSPRNYSMIVMLTVFSPNMNCPICKPAYEEFLIMANSYRYTFLNNKALYFGVVDYENAPQIFNLLNLNTAPAVFHFPAKGARRPQDSMDFQRMGIDAEAMAKFVQDRTDIHIRILRPPSYAAPVVILLLVMLVLGLLYMRRNNLEFLFNRTFWACVCLAIVFAFMSGQMWNHIRGPPFMMTHPHGRETSFIHGSTQYQLIAETYIVFGLYLAITAGVIVLNDAASSKTDPGRRKFMSCIGLGMVVVFFSLLLSVFRSKYHGYPYQFLFNFNFVITLCDQFVEQALVTEKELAQVGKIYLDQEDKICLRYKANDLWLCAMSCFACCNWDLGLLNVQKIQSLLDQLVKWTLLQEEIVQDPFDYFCSVTSSEKFDTKKIFSVWIYARWILLVDSEARFPSIPAKPTVSNPSVLCDWLNINSINFSYNYLDQSLLQAEKLAQTILDVQKKISQAIKLLDQMWNLYSGIYVPKKECFYPNLEVITEGSNLQNIGDFSKPDIQKHSWFFKLDIFQLRTAFDLLNAHFCAKHFSKAKTLFEFVRKTWQRLKNNRESIDVENKYFLPSEQDINGFACALGFDIPKENSSLCQSGDINLFMQFALVRPKHKIPVNILVELLSMGICRVSKIYLDKELRQSEELRLELIKFPISSFFFKRFKFQN
ncbi:unnamed protein product [Meloidogyne enterolobii]|uniref:Uncharacterized protein n=1 Tax=Meloidogyne enterolobii TaxID=390850 RepID=A0ACB1ADR2_MELEN